jgi:hypothetical protein
MARCRQILAIATFAVLSCVLAGCVAPMTEVELRARLDRVKTETPKRRAVQAVVPVHAETRMEAWVFYAEARTDPGESPLSLQLAQGFARGERRKVDYFVGGPYPKLADQVILNGLEMNRGRSLRGLRIVLVSADEPTDGLLTAVRARQARLEHHALP